MADRMQGFGNHRRFFPLYHFIAALLLVALSTPTAVKQAIREWQADFLRA